MSLPSFRAGWSSGETKPPRIVALEVRHPERPDDETVGWILVEKEETYERTGSGAIDNGFIRLTFKTLTTARSARDPGAHSFQASYSHSKNTVFLSGGAIFVDPQELRGHRLGTFLMNEIVTWAKQWPGAVVNTVTLLDGQAYAENKERRNRFYERFGLRFEYADKEHRAGHSHPLRVHDLKSVETWKRNIRVCDPLRFVEHILGRAERSELLAEQARLEVDALRERLRAQGARPQPRTPGWVVPLVVLTAVLAWLSAR